MLLEEIQKEKPGTFVGVRLSKESMEMIQEAMKSMDIPEPIDKGKMHITVIYSRKHLPDFKGRGKLSEDEKMVATPDELTIFPGRDGSNVLVLKIKCPELVKRHEQIMKEHEAEYDWPEYKPHVTLSYNAGDYKPEKAHVDNFGDIDIIEEYDQPLKTEWLVKKDDKKS